MRRIAVVIASLALTSACRSKSSSSADSGAPNFVGRAAATTIASASIPAEADPAVAALQATVGNRAFAAIDVTAFVTNRPGEKDPKRATTMLITARARAGETLTLDIPWNDGAEGTRSDARVMFATRTGSYSSGAGSPSVTITKLDKVSGATMLDADVEATLDPANHGTALHAVVHLRGLRVKALPAALQHL